jgi:hypothetical protein
MQMGVVTVSTVVASSPQKDPGICQTAADVLPQLFWGLLYYLHCTSQQRIQIPPLPIMATAPAEGVTEPTVPEDIIEVVRFLHVRHGLAVRADYWQTGK